MDRGACFQRPKCRRARSTDGGRVEFESPRFFTLTGKELIFAPAERTLGWGVPITPRLSQKLQQTLGGQEGAEFVNWMHRMDAHVSEVATRSDLGELRADFAQLETRLQRRIGDLIKWSFVFWVSAVAAIAMLVLTP